MTQLFASKSIPAYYSSICLHFIRRCQTFTFESPQFRKFKIYSLFFPDFSCTFGLITFIVLFGRWLTFSWQNSPQNAIIRLLKRLLIVTCHARHLACAYGTL